MSVESTALPLKRSSDYRAIVWGGLIAGAMDITAACINGAFYGRSPLWVFQSVASGLLGVNSYKGGLGSALLGGLIHFFIAFVWCSVYFVASRSISLLRTQPIICGLIYGVVVYLCMYGIVLRLTFHRNFLTPAKGVIVAVIIHMCCVGLPIALSVSRFSKSTGA
jgi:hypothetical protein